MKIRGTQILLYTESGKLAYEVSASLNQSNSVYELLPNSYSRKREYGILDWSIDGEFFYEQQGNYNYIIDKINQKEKVSVIIIEDGQQVRFGYGVIENITYNALNEQTVSFNATILASSKLSEFPEASFDAAQNTSLVRIINNRVYVLEYGTSQKLSYVGGSGLNEVFSNDSTLVPTDFTYINDSFYVLDEGFVKRYLKNGYIAGSSSDTTNTLSTVKRVFDNLGDYVAHINFDGVDSTIEIRELQKLAVYKTITQTGEILDFEQLPNGNILYVTGTTIFEKTFDDVIVFEKDLVIGSYTQTFQSSLKDLYYIFILNSSGNYRLSYIDSYGGTTLITTTLLTTSTEIKHLFEIEGNIIVAVLADGTFYMFKGKENISTGIVSGLTISDYDNIVLDSNGCVYHKIDANSLQGSIPIELSGVSSYDMPIFKLI